MLRAGVEGSREASGGPAPTETTAPATATREADGAVRPPAPTRRSDTPRRLGRYELLFALAHGGMGTVYAARLVGAHGFERPVAIKLLHDAVPEDARRAFLEEARLTSRIAHPNVVQTFELGEHDAVPFIVMELVHGVSLRELLDRLRSRGELLDIGAAVWMVAHAALGLHAAHELVDDAGHLLNVVHRDVSPHNILVSYDAHVYVADFGIAKLANTDHSTAEGVVKGKLSYMSPEQVRTTPLDRRSDVFSLGTVLYEALVGARPFTGDSPAGTVFSVLDHHPEPPGALRPGVPAGVDDVVMRCLDKDAAARFSTAADVAEALRAASRTAGIAFDEADLRPILDRLFSGERVRLRDRIRASTAARPAVPLRDDGAAEAPGDAGDASAAHVVVAPTRRLTPTRAAAATLLAAVAALALWVGVRSEGASVLAGPSSTPAPLAAPASAPVPEEPAGAVPSATAGPSTEAQTPPARSAASAEQAPRARAGASRPRLAAPSSSAAHPAPTQPSPEAPTQKGKVFDTL